MDNLRKAIHRVVSEKGEMFLGDGAVFGLLADYGAFEDDLAARDIFIALRDNGCLSALPGNWKAGSRNALYKLTTQRAFSEKKVYEVLSVLANECGADISSLNSYKTTAAERKRAASPVRTVLPAVKAKQSAMPALPPVPPYFRNIVPKKKRFRFRNFSRKTIYRTIGAIISAVLVTAAFLILPHLLRTYKDSAISAVVEEPTPHPTATFLYVQDELRCGYRGSRKFIPIQCDGQNTLAYSSRDWCQVRKTEKDGIVLFLERNNQLNERSCEVTISCDAQHRTLKVVQGYKEEASYAKISKFTYDNRAIHDGVRCLDVSFMLDAGGFENDELTAVVFFSVMDGLFSSRPMSAVDSEYTFNGQCACAVPVTFRGGEVMTVSVPFISMEHISNKWKYLYAAVAVYRKSEKGYVLVEKTGERHYDYPDDYDWIIPSVEISRFETRFNVQHNGKLFAEIHSDIRIAGLKGKVCNAVVYFHTVSGKLIKSASGAYLDSNGNLCTGVALDCIYDCSIWKDLVLYMDNEVLVPAMNRAGVKGAYVQLAVYDDDGKLMAESFKQQIQLCGN